MALPDVMSYLGGNAKTSDLYLQVILARENVDTGPASLVRGVQAIIEPVIRQWANVYLGSISPSGSFAKGTANKSGTDIDLFISLRPHTKETLKEIHDTLTNRLTATGYQPKPQNVSIGIKVAGYSVDLVPGKRQNFLGQDHSLWRRKAQIWTKTNVVTHITHVRVHNRLDETRIVKLWRDQHGLDFPSFCLELAVIAALPGVSLLTGQRPGLAGRVGSVFTYLRDTLPNARLVDPANTNNIVSDDLTIADKAAIKAAAARALQANNWNQVVT